MKNYSRQREAILSVLRSTDTHPTANWVYNKVKEQIPNISLGTVYRNLAELQKSGEIISLSVGDGHDHFDGDCSAHIHLHCKICGKIYDIAEESDYLAARAEQNGFMPEASVCIVYGICKNCK